MKAILFVLISLFSFAAFAQDADPIAEFFMKQEVWIALVILVWEYLVGRSKLESNSTIDLILSFIKMMMPKK